MTVQLQPWTCPKCQTVNDPDFTHCRKCATANPANLKAGENICAGCGQAHDKACCPSCNSPEFLHL